MEIPQPVPQPPSFPGEEPPKKPNTFSGQLGFWGIHCSLTALPSFLIAIQYFKGAPAVMAMVFGILTFIFGYAFLTSANFYGKLHQGLIGRSIKLGATIRMAISLCSLPLVFIAISGESGNDPYTEEIMWAPDFWFGFIAVIIVSAGFNLVGLRPPTNSWNNGDNADFLFTYLTTVTEGILISVSLLLVAFLALIILSFRKNRRQLPSDHFQVPPR